MKHRYRVFNDEEIKKLLKNKYVIKINGKAQIVYDNNFKLLSVEERIKYPEKSARQIFEENDFDMAILDERTPQRRLSSWMKKYKKFGLEYFIDNNKYTYKAIPESQKK